MKNKAVLWVIITLLVLSLSMTGFGIYVHVDKIKNPPPENPDKEFKLNNKLYFYDDNMDLVGTYDCQNSYCGYAKEMLDDISYNINYYKGAVSAEIKLINNRYAFIIDDSVEGSDKVVLYDVVNNREVKKLTAVKRYNVGIDKDYILVRNEDSLWGLMKISKNAGMVIDFKYVFMGLTNKTTEDGLVSSDAFIVFDTNGWKVISDSDVDLVNYSINKIYDYMDGYTITTNDIEYYLNDSSGEIIMSDNLKGLEFVEGYLKVFDANNDCYLYDVNTRTMVSEKHQVEYFSDLEVIPTLNGLELYLFGDLLETVPLK